MKGHTVALRATPGHIYYCEEIKLRAERRAGEHHHPTCLEILPTLHNQKKTLPFPVQA